MGRFLEECSSVGCAVFSSSSSPTPPGEEGTIRLASMYLSRCSSYCFMASLSFQSGCTTWNLSSSFKEGKVAAGRRLGKEAEWRLRVLEALVERSEE